MPHLTEIISVSYCI